MAESDRAAIGSARGQDAVLKVTRRAALGLLAAAASASKLGAQPRGAGGATAGIAIVRPDDLLILNIGLGNLNLVGTGAGRSLTLADARKPGLLVVRHQPQSIFEQAASAGPDPFPILTDVRMAGPSRVAFESPAGFAGLPFTLPSLLDAFSTWPMRLDPNAAPPPPPETMPAPTSAPAPASGLVLSQLAHVATVLQTKVSRSQSPEMARALERAGRRASAAMFNAARQGRAPTSADYSKAIAREVSAVYAGRTATAADRQTAARFVEAVAGAAVLNKGAPAGPAGTPPQAPAADVTALELPYHLIQTPLASAGWAHRTTAPPAAGAAGRTELWHTRLGTRVGPQVIELDAELLRAIWTPGYPSGTASASPPWPVGNVAMRPVERNSIVALTGDFTLKQTSGQAYSPRPSQARRLMLTALGATLDLEGDWSQRPKGIDLEQWKHRTAQGRDDYVNLTYAGFFWPLGHLGGFAEVTERLAGFVTPPDRIAAQRKSYQVLMREPFLDFTGAGQPYDGRLNPFRSIEAVTRVAAIQAPSNPAEPFVPIGLDGKPVVFRLVGTDGAGRKIPFEMPLWFIPASLNDPATLERLSKLRIYFGMQSAKTDLNGARIELAPPAETDPPGETAFSIKELEFTALIAAAAPGKAAFYPAMRRARTPALTSLKTLLGATADVWVSYATIYRDHGFSPVDAAQPGQAGNPGEVLLDLEPPASPPKVQNPDRFGGLVTPTQAPNGISRRFGAVGGGVLKGVKADGTPTPPAFDPADFLPPDMKLLGIVPLSSVLKGIEDLADPSGQVPHLTSMEYPDRIETHLLLQQDDLKPSGAFKPLPSNSALRIESTTVLSRGAAGSSATVNAKLTNFQVDLDGYVTLTFDELTLTAATGKKTDVKPLLNQDAGVTFAKELEFVNALREVIPSTGFSDPPALSITPSGLSASYDLTLPPISVGILSLTNVSLGASFDLPFLGNGPRARFHFGERQNPFNLTVSLFGGGGFFAVTAGTQGIIEVEAALEFGAQVSIDLGVASGGVYVKGGFYFHWKASSGPGTTGLVLFEGYVELGGHLSVLGLISASLVFHLGLAYEKDATAKLSRLYGEASLMVEVSVLFFSAAVTIHVERQFAGSKSDPTLADFSDAGTWTQYCSAFAA